MYNRVIRVSLPPFVGGALSRFSRLPQGAARNAVRLQSNSPGRAGKTKVKNPVHRPGKAKADRKDKANGNLPPDIEER